MIEYEPSGSSNISLSTDLPPFVERRGAERELAVLRVAKLVTQHGEELCRIRNISAAGIMAETAIRHATGSRVVRRGGSV